MVSRRCIYTFQGFLAVQAQEGMIGGASPAPSCWQESRDARVSSDQPLGGVNARSASCPSVGQPSGLHSSTCPRSLLPHLPSNEIPSHSTALASSASHGQVKNFSLKPLVLLSLDVSVKVKRTALLGLHHVSLTSPFTYTRPQLYTLTCPWR